jgi:hypothetical protein
MCLDLMHSNISIGAVCIVCCKICINASLVFIFEASVFFSGLHLRFTHRDRAETLSFLFYFIYVALST